MSISRQISDKIQEKWTSGKVIILTGPRQSGKTTLLKALCEKEGGYLFFNGDDPEDRLLLENAGENKLRNMIGNYPTLFFDEAQRIPNIGLLLKIIHDRIKGVRVVGSGSSSLDLANAMNETLTGRKWEFNLFPLSFPELSQFYGFKNNHKNLERYMIYGMYPEVITRENDSEAVLKELAGSYLYKDVLQYKSIRKPEVLDKLLLALALQLGSEVNYHELSRLVGIDRATVENYISLLEKAFIVFRLNPLARNVRNEINTSRKVYFYDNGIRNTIIGNFKALALRQDVSALWENFMISERVKQLSYRQWHGRHYFWRTYQQQEIDWIEEIDGAFSAFEFNWNHRSKQKKMPKTFMDHYEVKSTMVVTPENCSDFLLIG